MLDIQHGSVQIFVPTPPSDLRKGFLSPCYVCEIIDGNEEIVRYHVKSTVRYMPMWAQYHFYTDMTGLPSKPLTREEEGAILKGLAKNRKNLPILSRDCTLRWVLCLKYCSYTQFCRHERRCTNYVFSLPTWVTTGYPVYLWIARPS